ncbi:hypothetical protein BC477_15490 [Clavibacter michiganensis subsp. michiganensis]|uniref:Uncharacterized protein n=1 Tax=Clavibacter michiganensis subsp. michiganensis TaxID=33013 RepID=A0A251XF63_CLAMM|nr:hypothetical protein BC477_15490 [Clavibacter michiganensis subsp. michiganensis]OUE01209.1 hypothetical protein CMMCAS07_12950 [Clavibacter michiganensis subsp. michiganensis]
MSAAFSPRFWGVPTAMKCTRDPAASAVSVVKRRRPVASCSVRRSGRPGSKNGATPVCSVAIFAASTSMATTSCPRRLMHAAWTVPR